MNVIDIGSNSVRLLCSGKKTVITTRLAENMVDDCLHPEAIKRTVQAIKSLQLLSSSNCKAFATEAVRKAKNKSDFLSKVYAATGINVDVISGDEEAKISFLGATSGYDGDAAVIDLGGASCEIIFGSGGKIDFKRSYPFGCVKLCDKFGCDFDSIMRHVNDTLKDLPSLKAQRYIAVGGTVTSLAAMAQNLTEYTPCKVHGYKLKINTIMQLITQVIEGKEFATLNHMRRKTIAQGSAAIAAVMNALGITELEVSEKDNLEGYTLLCM